MNDQPPHVLAEDLRALFRAEPEAVAAAVAAALSDEATTLELPGRLAGPGVGAERALALVTPYVRGAARDLGDPGFLAHMDPPTPWPTWVATLLAASTNQNLLHPDTAPAARELERRVVDWLSPVFAMSGGHLVPGSTVANLTALWAARELTGASTVAASTSSHLSIRKAAAILGLRYAAIEPTVDGALSAADVADRFARSAPGSSGGGGGTALDPRTTILVATAGTTGTGAIDELDPGAGAHRPAWLHVDAAWAGPLRFSRRHRHRLDGIGRADSVAVSAHKWLFQPKESAVVLFADAERAHRAVSVDEAYLQVPNLGLLGSHGATAAPLAATLLALGLDGVEGLVDHGMAVADRLVELIDGEPRLARFGPNHSGVVAWRHRYHGSAAIRAELAGAVVSTVDIGGRTWLRSVAANPLADPATVVSAVLAAGERLDRAEARPQRPES